MQIIKSQSIIQQQAGAVLVTALVLMTILAIIGITSMRGNIMDIKIHKAMKSRANAFQCAEAALREGELWIDKLARVPIVVVQPNQASFQFWDGEAVELRDMEVATTNWWALNAWEYTGDLALTNNQVGCALIPYYLIEHMGSADGGSNNAEFLSDDLIDYFRITARSVGIDDTVAVVLQTTYGKRIR
jgi:type IV pilus assembly protein PilX